ncbi:MAG: DUF4249 domain-containing protein [Bacteroidales bacterium]|jgi:hypothetical protein|nr:DUF4249 domain-containing protein [Bacteroidales bacterium]
MRRLYIIATILILLQSCEEKTELTLDTIPPKIVVNGILTDEFIHQQINLTRTSDYFSNKAPEGLSGAEITVAYNNITETFTETATPGVYESNQKFKAEPDITYNLKITNAVLEGKSYNLEASSKVKEGDNIAKISLAYSDKKESVRVYMHAENSVDGNNYACRAIKNNIMVSDTLTEYILFTEKDYGNISYNGLWVYNLDLTKPTEAATASDVISIEFLNISDEYYEFLNAAQQAANHNPMMSSPPANIYTNLNGGAIGVFGVCTKTVKSAVLTQEIIDMGSK